jgi:hypothetical protein
MVTNRVIASTFSGVATRHRPRGNEVVGDARVDRGSTAERSALWPA